MVSIIPQKINHPLGKKKKKKKMFTILNDKKPIPSWKRQIFYLLGLLHIPNMDLPCTGPLSEKHKVIYHQ